jgi:ribosomal protein S12 methylthiotransferase
MADAPEINDGVFIDDATHLKLGDFVKVEIEEVDEYHLWAI